MSNAITRAYLPDSPRVGEADLVVPPCKKGITGHEFVPNENVVRRSRRKVHPGSRRPCSDFDRKTQWAALTSQLVVPAQVTQHRRSGCSCDLRGFLGRTNTLSPQAVLLVDEEIVGVSSRNIRAPVIPNSRWVLSINRCYTKRQHQEPTSLVLPDRFLVRRNSSPTKSPSTLLIPEQVDACASDPEGSTQSVRTNDVHLECPHVGEPHAIRRGSRELPITLGKLPPCVRHELRRMPRYNL